jgi:cell pole-organizing protein PopZ
MAAKNTISILETIKKKMQKFDNKTASPVANIVSSDNEFQYISPKTQTQGSAPMASSIPPQKMEIKFEDDLGLEDLDNENAFEHKADTGENKSLAPQNVEEDYIFNEEEIEESEAEEKIEEFDDEVVAKEADVVQEEHVDPQEEDHDLEHHELEDDLENLDLNELEHEDVAQNNPAPNETAELSDEELDKLLLEEDASATPPPPAAPKAQAEVKPAAEEREEDFNFDNFEEDEKVAEPVVEKFVEQKQPLDYQNARAAAPSMKMPRVDAIHDIMKGDEVDLEFEKEFMGFEVKKDKLAQPPMHANVAPENFARQNVVQNMQREMPRQFQDHAISYQERPAGIINEETMVKTTESVKKLIDAKNMMNSVGNFTQNPMLSELALQLMEPKLEKWFHENLPQMVERIVAEEIRKIIPKQ